MNETETESSLESHSGTLGLAREVGDALGVVDDGLGWANQSPRPCARLDGRVRRGVTDGGPRAGEGSIEMREGSNGS